MLHMVRGVKEMESREFPVAEWVKDLALPLQWLRSLLWYGFDPWPRNIKKKKEKEKKRKKEKEEKNWIL